MARFDSSYVKRVCGLWVRGAPVVLTAALWLTPAGSALLPAVRGAQPVPELGALKLSSLPEARFRFHGRVGARVEANLENWLLRAPQANPGLLEMFRMRDRQPAPQLVPWAGEFVGKYLISAVAGLRLTDDPRLFLQVSNVVAAFVRTQAEDGYLGPFPKDVRLLKNWDLWGHYHALEALMLWHEFTGDTQSLEAARKAADLVCRTYLDTGRRVFDAGDPEMNMAILTGLARLYRLTGEQRYLQMAFEVEKDWERAGDYLRWGLGGREFYQGPRPRWESLHDLQGLLELWRITGKPEYRQAFEHHWRSIRRWDQRNTGGFSSGEQATGNPFAPTPIETCCTVAWLALTVDYLRLTGDGGAADDLEFSTLNAGLGAQHPSGRWWTYNTPMDGVREASAHTIVFQARAGTPELNCCSVNGPRVLGMLADWTVMSGADGLTVNTYLPMEVAVPAGAGETCLRLDWDYPRTNAQRIVVTRAGGDEWTLRLRMPAWSAKTRIKASFDTGRLAPKPGTYLEVRRQWRAGDELTLYFDFELRFMAGANEAAGQVSLQRGPLLLAYDQCENSFDDNAIPLLELARLSPAGLSFPVRDTLQGSPWVRLGISGADGRVLNLIDFASAGAQGTRYRTWLPVTNPPPAPAFTQRPGDGEQVRPGPVQFRWRGPARATGLLCRLEISGTDRFDPIILATNTSGYHVVVDLATLPEAPGKERWWRVITVGPGGESRPDVPPARFALSPDAPAQPMPARNPTGPKGEVIAHDLRDSSGPKYGKVSAEKFATRDQAGTQLDGRSQMLVYSLPEWPEEDFTVTVRVRLDELPQGRLGQIFSAWARPMDDPLRLVVDKGKVFARIEAGGQFATEGLPVEAGQWYRIAAVKRGAKLSLWVDGRQVGASAAPFFSETASRLCALGGNPLFPGNEFLAATFADFGLWDRALSEQELSEVFLPP